MASNPFARFGMSDAEFDRHLRESTEIDAGIDDFMENEVIPYGRSVSPVDSGKFAASWAVMKKAKNGKGVVGPKAWYAHFVEFGTGADKKARKPKKAGKGKRRGKSGRRPVKIDGDFRMVGPDTPTKAMAPVQKTASHFGGSLTDVSFEGHHDD